MDFVALLESAEDGDGILDRGLADHHRLETTLEGGVLFDVLAVFVERGRADGAQFAAGELGFEQVRGIHRALAGSGADDGVELVDEEDDLALGIGDFLEERLEPLLELAAVFRAGEHAAEVHGDDALVLHRVRHVAGNDAAGEALDDGGLADAGLADEHRIVLRAAGKHLEHAADFVVAADDGIDFPLPGAGGEVGAVFFQRLVFSLRVVVGDLLRAADAGDGFAGLFLIQSRLLEQLAGGRIALQGTEQEMLHAEIVVAQRLAGGIRGIQGGAETDADLRLGGRSLHARFAGERGGDGRV